MQSEIANFMYTLDAGSAFSIKGFSLILSSTLTPYTLYFHFLQRGCDLTSEENFLGMFRKLFKTIRDRCDKQSKIATSYKNEIHLSGFLQLNLESVVILDPSSAGSQSGNHGPVQGRWQQHYSWTTRLRSATETPPCCLIHPPASHCSTSIGQTQFRNPGWHRSEPEGLKNPCAPGTCTLLAIRSFGTSKTKFKIIFS